MQAVARAQQLFRSGQFEAGLSVLADAARDHQPDALEMLGAMALAGDLVERDLPLCRKLYAQAADAGSSTARAAYRAFVASGLGAPRDWQAALQLLKRDRDTDPDAAQELEILEQMALDDQGDPARQWESRALSDSPDVRQFPGLFSDDECNFLIDRAAASLAPSVVVDPATGRLVGNPVRTSESTAFPLVLETPAVHALCRRLAQASGTDVRQGEPLQVLCYRGGQEYHPHFDAIDGAENQRVLTFLVYLNDDYSGGETEFLATGLKVKGARGDGVLFRNASGDGARDPRSRHAGLPVHDGRKFLASRWIRSAPFTPTQ